MKQLDKHQTTKSEASTKKDTYKKKYKNVN
jgi:hypothetical protein